MNEYPPLPYLNPTEGFYYQEGTETIFYYLKAQGESHQIEPVSKYIQEKYAPTALIAVIGGADRMGITTKHILSQKLPQALSHIMTDPEFTSMFLDGATDSGVIQFTGKAKTLSKNFRSVVVGVAPYRETTHYRQDKTHIEPHHDLVVLVDSGEHNSFGDETQTMMELAVQMRTPIVAIAANGGYVTGKEILGILNIGGHVILLEGTERITDGFCSIITEKTPSSEQGKAGKTLALQIVEEQKYLPKNWTDNCHILPIGDVTPLQIAGTSLDILRT